MSAPRLPILPPAVHGQDMLVLPVFSPLQADAMRDAVGRIAQFGQPLGMHVGAMPHAAWRQAFDALLTPGARNYWKSHNFTRLSDDAIDTIDTIVRYAGKLPTTQCEVFLSLTPAAGPRQTPPSGGVVV